jgi:hypothetical protein
LPNTFFIPGVSGESAETLYAQFADLCGSAVPAPNGRIREIHWKHEGDHWVATVGEKLRGRHVRVRDRTGAEAEVRTPLTDPVTVLAIFRGAPFYVVTNGWPVGSIRGSLFVSPFMAADPTEVHRFDASESE